MGKIKTTRSYRDGGGTTRHRRGSRRLLTVLSVVTLAVTGLTGAGFAGVLPFVSSPATGTGGMCARTLSAESDLSTLPPGIEFDPADPAAACAGHWDEMWADGTAKPDRFAACFHPSGPGGGGGAVVYPADGHRDAVAACAAIGAKAVPVRNS